MRGQTTERALRKKKQNTAIQARGDYSLAQAIPRQWSVFWPSTVNHLMTTESDGDDRCTVSIQKNPCRIEVEDNHNIILEKEWYNQEGSESLEAS